MQVWLWRQGQEQQGSCIRGTGRAQVLRREVQAGQLGKRVGPLQAGGHGEARQTHAGLDLLSSLTHKARFPPNAAEIIAAGAAC